MSRHHYHSLATQLSLDEVLQRLDRSPAVMGVLLLGSARHGDLEPHSDIDLNIVLYDLAESVATAFTHIAGHLTDIGFFSARDIETVLKMTPQPVAASSHLGFTLLRLQQGEIVVEHDERLASAKEKASAGGWLISVTEREAYNAWYKLNFNLAHLGRYLGSKDPNYRHTAEIRLSIYGSSDLLFNYFRMRRLVWLGEKQAVEYLLHHSPDYLHRYLDFLRENDIERKAEMYYALAARAAEPFGGLWDEEQTRFKIREDMDYDADVPARAFVWWERLLGD